MSGARRARQVLGGAGGAFYAWWMFWASEGAKATIEETTAPALGLALSAATWARDGVQALVARVTGAPRMLTQPQPPWPRRASKSSGACRRVGIGADGWASERRRAHTPVVPAETPATLEQGAEVAGYRPQRPPALS